MNALQDKYRDVIVRVVAYSRKYPEIFAPEPGASEPGLGEELVAEITRISSELHDNTVIQSAAIPATDNELKSRLRDQFKSRMYTVSRAVRYAAGTRKEPAILSAFPLKATTSDQELLRRADAFANAIDRFNLEPELLGLKLESNARFRERIEEFRAMVLAQKGSVLDRIGATKRIEGLIERGRVVIHGLDAIVRVVVGEDSQEMAVWESASHLVRRKRSKAKQRVDAATEPSAESPTGGEVPTNQEPVSEPAPSFMRNGAGNNGHEAVAMQREPIAADGASG